MATVFATSFGTTRAARTSLLTRYGPFLIILLVVFAIRAPTFGNPVLDFDEQLYLAVGDRILHGQLPYVDMWDRKPLGLFLIFALIRLLLGGEGIVQYQIVAAGCVVGTAALIFTMGRHAMSRRSALLAALAYTMLLNPLHGAGGQSPVIYNLFTAIAAWATFRATGETRPGRLIMLALLTMAMAGLAIQCKYTPVVEGCYFGLIFLWLFWRAGFSAARMLAVAVAMIALALAPTVAAFGWYWRLGHLDAMLQANLWSTFARHPFPAYTRIAQRIYVSIIGGPALLLTFVRLHDRWKGRINEDAVRFWFPAGWLVAALIGFLMLGDFYDFYLITVLPPLLLVAGPVADRGGRIGFAAILLLTVYPFLLSLPRPGLAQQRRADMSRLVGAVRPYLAGGRCLYVYDGPTSLYLLTQACVPTRFIYPDHLNNPTELPALGVDGQAEERRLLATRPGAIVTADRPLIPHVDPGTRAILLRVLAREYVRTARIAMAGDRTFDVWALRSLHPAAGVLPRLPPDPQ